MSDLLPPESLPPAGPPSLIDPPAAKPPEPAKPATPDYVEQALIKERDAQIALKQAQAIEHRFGKHAPALEAIEKGDVRGGLKALLGEKYKSELLYEIATDFASAPKLTPEQEAEAKIKAEVEKALEADKAKAQTKAEDEAKKQAEATRAENAKVLQDHLGRAGAYLKANASEYPYLRAKGAPEAEYRKLLNQYVTEHRAEPEPGVIYKLMESAAAERYSAAGLGPKKPPALSLEDHVQQTFEKHKPQNKPAEKPDRPMTPIEQARARLADLDREQAGRVDWSR